MANITKRTNSKGQTVYRIRVCNGVKGDGTPRTWSMTWKPPASMTARQAEKEALKQSILFEEKIEEDLKHGLTGEDVKFKELADEWLELVGTTGELKTSSIIRMKSCAPRTYAAIGNVSVKELNYRQIQQFVVSLSKDGINERTGKGLSAKSQKHYITFISDVMKYAKKCGYVSVNPCQDVSVVKTDDVERSPYSLEEEVALLEAMDRRDVLMKYQIFFRFMIYCGMRRGEVLGLEWQDIDLQTGICSISRTSAYSNSETGIYTTTPKTKSSRRTLRLPPDFIQLIKRYKLYQNGLRVQLGDLWHESGRLITSEDGTPLFPGTPYNWLKKFCEQEGIPFRGIHSFRHAFATEMITSGQVDIKTVSAILGHSQTSTTLNIYAHEVQIASAQAMDFVSGIINSKLA